MRLPKWFGRTRPARPQEAPSEGRRSTMTGDFASIGGFTMIEVLTVAVVMGTLVRIALPNVHAALLRARAAEVAGEFETVRLAVLSYQAEHLSWPEDTYVGQVPSGLAEFLPDDFDFRGARYRLDWENWVLPSGLPEHPEIGELLGISVVTEDVELGYAVVDMLGNTMPHYTLGTSYTFVIERR